MSAGLSGASKYSRIALFAVIATGVLLIISYACPFWTTTEYGHAGLWISCEQGNCYERWNMWVEGWVRATQFMMSLGLACWTFSFFSLFLYVFQRNYDEDKRMVFLSAVTIFLTGLLTFLSVVTWAAGQHYGGSGEMLNWAYIMSCIVTIGSYFTFYVLLKELNSPIEL